MDVARFVLLAVLLFPVLGRSLSKKNDQRGRENSDRDIFDQRVNDSDDISLSRVKRTDVSETNPFYGFRENKKMSPARRSTEARSSVDQFESRLVFPKISPQKQVILSRVKRRHV